MRMRRQRRFLCLIIPRFVFTALFGFLPVRPDSGLMSVVGYAVICGVSVVIFLYNRPWKAGGRRDRYEVRSRRRTLAVEVRRDGAVVVRAAARSERRSRTS